MNSTPTATYSPKIVFVGAGSTVFTKNLLGDVLGYADLACSRITLFDIDAERLATSEVVAHRVARTLGASPTIMPPPTASGRSTAPTTSLP